MRFQWHKPPLRDFKKNPRIAFACTLKACPSKAVNFLVYYATVLIAALSTSLRRCHQQAGPEAVLRLGWTAPGLPQPLAGQPGSTHCRAGANS